MNVHGLRRNVKNVVKNYTDAQVKVREATSNDPWGPSSTLMSEIADLTYNVVAFSEIMQMIWKRLNDHGKNWRHVYKALMLLEYLIKTGSEKVAQQCKENIFAIQTLKDFQYIEENKDQGMNVREKSKQLVSLLKDDERLKSERARALKAKERLAQANCHGGKDVQNTGKETSDSIGSPDGASSPRGFVCTELEIARPQTAGEEELQLQLALAMSKEEAEQEERVRRNDDLRLQMALTESEENYKKNNDSEPDSHASGIDDLLALNLSPGSANASDKGTPILNTDPWGMPLETKATPVTDPWALSPSATVAAAIKNDPWTTPTPRAATGIPHSASAPNDPWSLGAGDNWPMKMSTSASVSFETLGRTNGELEDKDFLSRRSAMSSPDTSVQRSTPNPFDVTGMRETHTNNVSSRDFSMGQQSMKKTPENFLGANSNLVNLDALVSTQDNSHGMLSETTSPASLMGLEPIRAFDSGNPFGIPPPVNNPFQATRPPPPTINQLRSQTQFVPYTASPLPTMMAQPIMPTPNMAVGGVPVVGPFSGASQTTNPFL